jgi:phage I-like protein
MSIRTLALTLLGGGHTPPKEQRLFSFGVNDTLKGDFILTRTGAEEVMARYRAHGVRLMLDYEHMSLDENATPEQKKASGRGDLEIRDDGLYLVNIKWTPQAAEHLRNGEYAYLSPAFHVDDDNQIIEVINVALTNLPATNDQPQLVAANRLTLTNKEQPMKKHLQAALQKHGGHEGLAKHLGWDGAKLSKHLGGDPMTHEEMKHCAMKLGLTEHDLEDEHAPIDTSMNGVDVNKSQGSPSDGTLSGLFELMGGEAHVPTTGGEASEDQAGGLHLNALSRSAAETLVKLAGTNDPKRLADLILSLKQRGDTNADAAKQLVELRRGIENAHREQLITASMPKMSPRQVAFARKLSIANLKEYLDSLPATVELHEPAPNPTNGGSKMVTLTREDKEVARLSGKTEAEFAKIKEDLGDEHLITLAGQRAYEGRKPAPAADKAEKSNWDHKYADHFMTLSMTDATPDGKPWKPAPGSKWSPASKLP